MQAAEDLAEVITAEVLGLVKSSAAYIRSEWGWNTVCALMKAASHHPAAFPMALEALSVVIQEGHLMRQNFQPCLETSLSFINNSQKHGAPERATQVHLRDQPPASACGAPGSWALSSCFVAERLCAHVDARL